MLRRMNGDGVPSAGRRMILKARFKWAVDEYQVNLLTFQCGSLK